MKNASVTPVVGVIPTHNIPDQEGNQPTQADLENGRWTGVHVCVV